MWTSILSTSIVLPKPPLKELSSVTISSDITKYGIFPAAISDSRRDFAIRMGGGPRTFPGGVSKWQWKRMQAKKAKQLLKARLCRERQLYEMRKRAELKSAVSELERPWEVVEKAPTLFSVRADEKLKVLADRFQKPGGFDMWSERDGPQVFRTPDGLPSARFFPKGAVHSVKPYGVIRGDSESDVSSDVSDDEEESQFPNWIQRGRGGKNWRSRGYPSNHVSNGYGDGDGMDVGVGSSHSKSSESSRSPLGTRKDASDGRRKSAGDVKGDFKGNFQSGGPRNGARRQQQLPGGRNGLNPDFSSRPSRGSPSNHVSNGYGDGDWMDVGVGSSHSKSSESSRSPLGTRKDASDGRRKSADDAKGDFKGDFQSGGPRNGARRRQQLPGGRSGLNPDFKWPQSEQI